MHRSAVLSHAKKVAYFDCLIKSDRDKQAVFTQVIWGSLPCAEVIQGDMSFERMYAGLSSQSCARASASGRVRSENKCLCMYALKQGRPVMLSKHLSPLWVFDLLRRFFFFLIHLARHTMIYFIYFFAISPPESRALYLSAWLHVCVCVGVWPDSLDSRALMLKEVSSFGTLLWWLRGAADMSRMCVSSETAPWCQYYPLCARVCSVSVCVCIKTHL